MNLDRQTSLPDFSAWIDSRQSHGLYFFTKEEVLKSSRRSEAAFKQAAARLARKKRIARIRRGFFIIIPLEYAATGVLPAEWFIADLMKYIGKQYYVGLLSAAALYGAAHHQPQQFHVVTTGPLREMRLNGLAITFFSKSKLTDVPLGQVKTLQNALNVFLGEPRRKQKESSVTLAYKVVSEGPPVIPLRLKVEINTREHFTVFGFRKRLFNVNTRWFEGGCEITTFELEELLATKVRALYQRRKGRDLFDLWYGLSEGKADAGNIVKIFKEYMKVEGHRIKREDYEKNIEAKMKHRGFIDDVKPLLPADMKYNVKSAFSLIGEQLVAHI